MTRGFFFAIMAEKFWRGVFGMIEIGVGLVAGILIILALKFFIELPLKIIWNSIIGAAILYLVNLTGLIMIKITFVHALIVGVFGVPGLILLAIYLNFIK